MPKEKELLRRASETDYASFYRELKAGDIRPLYLIYGEEAFLIERAVAMIREEFLKGDGETALHTFSGDEVNVRDILDLCNTIPLFGEKRYVEIKRCEELGKKGLDDFRQYFINPHPSTLLLIWGVTAREGKGRSFSIPPALRDAAMNKGRVLFFPFKKRWEVKKWVQAEMKRASLNMEEGGVELLIELTQGNLREISRFIEKMQFFHTGKGVIGGEEMEELGIRVSLSDIWGLQKSLGLKDYRMASTRLAGLLVQGMDPSQIMGMIISFYRRLFELKWRERKGEPISTSLKAVKISPYYADTYRKYVSLYTEGEIRGIMEEVFSTQLKMRSSRLPPPLLLEELLFYICNQAAGVG